MAGRQPMPAPTTWRRHSPHRPNGSRPSVLVRVTALARPRRATRPRTQVAISQGRGFARKPHNPPQNLRRRLLPGDRDGAIPHRTSLTFAAAGQHYPTYDSCAQALARINSFRRHALLHVPPMLENTNECQSLLARVCPRCGAPRVQTTETRVRCLLVHFCIDQVCDQVLRFTGRAETRSTRNASASEMKTVLAPMSEHSKTGTRMERNERRPHPKRMRQVWVETGSQHRGYDSILQVLHSRLSCIFSGICSPGRHALLAG